MVGQNIGNGSSKLRGGCHIDCSAGKKYRDAAKRLNVSLDRVLSQHEAAALLCAKKNQVSCIDLLAPDVAANRDAMMVRGFPSSDHPTHVREPPSGW
jgi:hypothetical protein